MNQRKWDVQSQNPVPVEADQRPTENPLLTEPSRGASQKKEATGSDFTERHAIMQGTELRDIRKQMEMTQAELAEALDLSQPFIGMMERGEKPIEKRTELAVRYLLGERKAQGKPRIIKI